MPAIAPMTDIIRPSSRNILVICLSVAPMLRSVTTSFFLSIMSIDSEPIMLKQATTSMNVRIM